MEAIRKTETMAEFFRDNCPVPVINSQFNVFENGEYICKPMPYSRRDFYKISLTLSGGLRFLYADKGIEVVRPALVFSNPRVPYACDSFETETTPQGYFCIFTEEFMSTPGGAHALHESPLFKVGADPVFFLNDQQRLFLSGVFEQMRSEFASRYVHKLDLLRNYVSVILHEALKMQASTDYFRHANAATRIASMFIELLDRQFPVDPDRHALKLKTAAHFADCLSIHVNHLNQAVKEVTGRTTTEHITARIITEAKSLLKHTTWSIADIAYSLGYEYPAYFSNQFKKQTGETPGKSRG
jgi:AraC family transcriptional regulator, transcriptional activator of pobA